MGINSSRDSDDDYPSTISFRVKSITNNSICNILRNYGIDSDAINLLREAALAIDNFDSYRHNMKIRAYGDNTTYIITAGDGDNVLDIRRDGNDKIVCKWVRNSFRARVFKVWVPKLCLFLGSAAIGIGANVGRKAIGF